MFSPGHKFSSAQPNPPHPFLEMLKLTWSEHTYLLFSSVVAPQFQAKKNKKYSFTKFSLYWIYQAN